MGFAMGSCLNSPLYHSLFPLSSTPTSSDSVFLQLFPRNADYTRKNKKAMAFKHHGDPNASVFCNRRAILFVGISVIPPLKLRAEAVEGLALDDSKMRTQGQKEITQQTRQGDVSQNLFLFLLNVLGVLGSGVLGPLYALSQKEKAITEATIDSMKNKLNEKEATIVSLQKNFDKELLNEKEERNKQLNKANEERQSLINQLQSANSTIKGLGQELQKEKKVVEGLIVQIDNLTNDLAKVGKDKTKLEEQLKEKIDSVEVLQDRINLLSLEINDKEDSIRDFSSKLVAKELEFKKLSSIYEQTQNEVARLNSDIRGLKDDLLSSGSELERKNAAVDDLNVQVGSLLAERDDFNRKLDDIKKEYNDLKLSSEKRAASDSKLLDESVNKLQQLKQRLELALDEVSKNKVFITDLTQERDDLRKSLDGELEIVKNLEQELQITRDALVKSQNEARDLSKQLQQSGNLCAQLEAEISKVRAKSAEAKEIYQRNLLEAKQSAEILAGELTSTKEILLKTQEEIQTLSGELAAAAEIHDNLKKELVDVYKDAETAVQDLKEEKKMVTSLNKELKALESQILKDKEARKSLETDLEEATKSLDEMNRNALILSRDLELANSQVSSLQDEKDVLYNSLVEQKQLSQAAQENMEDAHNLMMKLGKEREKFEKKSRKLEEEVASAKGEILRLRSRINSSKAPVNNVGQQKGEEGSKAKVPVNNVDQQKGVEESKAKVQVKRTTRRRKVTPQNETK